MEISRVQALSKRMEQSHAWGDVVWHVWGLGEGDVGQTPLVLLHGGSGSWTHWLRNVEHISQYRQVWALDIPGFGDSSLPAGVTDADGLVPYINQVLEKTFHSAGVDVMGFSFGGMLAGLVAAEHTSRISQLILVGVPGLGLFSKELPMRGMTTNMDLAAQREVHRHNLNAMMLHHPQSVTDEVIDLQHDNVSRDRLRRRRIARTDILVKVQSRWTCPVHGVWGDQDALYANTLKQVPNVLTGMTSFTRVPHAGHWVMFEQPEAFHEVVDAWLKPA